MPHAVSDTATEILRRLRSTIAGPVLAPADPDYEAARRSLFAMFDGRPLAVVQPASAADVAHALRVARDHGLPVAVKSGGHSPAGHSTIDGGLLIDLSRMRSLDVDAAEGTAWGGAGLTAREFSVGVAEHGLAVGFGDTGTVGISGITLCGGVGFLHRKLGLTVDSVLAMEVVTASGEIVEASSASHPELFWALRGGGGNFGVVTRIRYRPHPVDPVHGGFIIFPATPDRVVRLVEVLQEAPDDVSGMVNVAAAPPAPFIPAEYHGRLIAMAAFIHAGEPDAGERFARGIRALGAPIIDTIRPMRYSELFEQPEPPMRAGTTSHSTFREAVDLAAAEAVLEALARGEAPLRVVQFRVLGGEVARVPSGATAVPWREHGILAVVNTSFEDVAALPEHVPWGARIADALREADGRYIGFMGDEGEAGARSAFPAETLARLAAVKATYDPENVFRSTQNIPPA